MLELMGKNIHNFTLKYYEKLSAAAAVIGVLKDNIYPVSIS